MTHPSDDGGQGTFDWGKIGQEARGAIEQVENAAKPEWLRQAYEALVRCAEENETFISDDVWRYDLKRTREDRALGPVFLRAKRQGIIEKTGTLRPSVRSHLSGKPVWRSLIPRKS